MLHVELAVDVFDEGDVKPPVDVTDVAGSMMEGVRSRKHDGRGTPC